MSIAQIKGLFLLAAAYDGILAVIAVLFARPLFQWFGVEAPNHYGYVQFPALLLLVFAAMFLRISQDPVRFAELIPFGVGLKAAYCAVVFWNQMTGSVPSMWVPWAWVDLAFLALFLVARRSLKTAR
ncbi:MAG: hypothetical protein AB7Q16_00380 [Vicinamibacterales bacterium]